MRVDFNCLLSIREFCITQNIKKLIEWDKKNKRLKDQYFRYMFNVATGKTTFDAKAIELAELNIKAMKRFGFRTD
jgi:hypothetical protein